MKTVTERFLKYVSFDTQSDEFSETCPSTDKQKALGAYLVEEMKAMGIEDARMDEHGYVYGTVPGDPRLPTIGLIAHMDTAPGASGAEIKAKIVEYTGGDVCLNEEQGIFLRESDYPSLKNHIGKHLIVTDGTTLLGADDKAGIAEILTLAEQLLADDSFKHGPVQIAFTPDEEIGRGADLFDVPGFGADFAYTLDGGAYGELEYENFNAASMKVEVQGKNIHPGSAKNKMKNAMTIAMEFQPIAVVLFLGSACRSPMNALINGSGNHRVNFATAILDGIVMRVGLSVLLGLVLHMEYLGFWLGDALAGYTPFFIGLVYYFTGAWKTRKYVIKEEK